MAYDFNGRRRSEGFPIERQEPSASIGDESVKKAGCRRAGRAKHGRPLEKSYPTGIQSLLKSRPPPKSPFRWPKGIWGAHQMGLAKRPPSLSDPRPQFPSYDFAIKHCSCARW
jgi:hypothetical protein